MRGLNCTRIIVRVETDKRVFMDSITMSRKEFVTIEGTGDIVRDMCIKLLEESGEFEKAPEVD